jgi:hypothetical protein
MNSVIAPQPPAQGYLATNERPDVDALTRRPDPALTNFIAYSKRNSTQPMSVPHIAG